MTELLSSKVIVTEDAPALSSLPGDSAAVSGMVGVTERGPVGRAVLCTEKTFPRIFGGYVQSSELPQSALAYFRNGGRSLYVVRVVHYANIADPSTVTAKAAQGLLRCGKDVLATVRAKEVGVFGNRLRVDISTSAKGIDVTVSRGTNRLDQWQGLSTDPNRENDFARVINETSQHVTVERLLDTASAALEPQTLLLADGDDGLSGLTDLDYLGDPVAKTGLRALDGVLSLSAVAIPGASPVVQRGIVDYCERVRRGRVFPVFDLPMGIGAEDAARYVEQEKLLESTEHGAAYWPRPLISNPAQHVWEGTTLSVSPCGFAMGVLARNTASRPGGIYIPPAGVEAGQLHGVVGFDNTECLDEDRRDIVYPARINPLTTGEGLPYFIDGSRTLKSSGNCPWIAHRRGMSFISRNLERRLQYVRHKSITSSLLAQTYRDTVSFLIEQMRDGAFASQDAKTAFHVEPPFVGRNATVEVSVGLAFAQPAEFIWLHLTVQTGTSQGGD